MGRRVHNASSSGHAKQTPRRAVGESAAAAASKTTIDNTIICRLSLLSRYHHPPCSRAAVAGRLDASSVHRDVLLLPCDLNHEFECSSTTA